MGDYVIPSGIISILDSTFSNCTGLTGVTIPNNISSIGNNAFWGCTGLTSVDIRSVTYIGYSAFKGCTKLTAITVDGDNPSYASQDGVLFNTGKTSLILYPCGKSGIYTVPATVTYIGAYAFSGCAGLTSVTVPSSVTGIGSHAFSDCSALVLAYFYGAAPAGDDTYFFNSGSGTVYYWPKTVGWGGELWWLANPPVWRHNPHSANH